MSEEDSLDAVINIMKIKRLVKEVQRNGLRYYKFYVQVQEIVEE